MKKNFLSALFAKMPTRQEMEIDYLNKSVSIHDLERREREIARGRFRKA
jgi:hypothetical protein